MGNITKKYTQAEDVVSATRLEPVTPSDDEIRCTRGLYVGGDGDLAVVPVEGDGSTITITGVKGGMIYPFQVIKILSATTATGIIALY